MYNLKKINLKKKQKTGGVSEGAGLNPELKILYNSKQTTKMGLRILYYLKKKTGRGGGVREGRIKTRIEDIVQLKKTNKGGHGGCI